jgi:flavorubredoxin
MLDNILNRQSEQNFDVPVLLFEKGDHKVYWLGMAVPDAFRTNIYLIVDGDEAIVIDPGNKAFYGELYDRVEKLGYIDKITGGIFCHQDPDVAGSIADWVSGFRNFKVITSARTNVLLPHYGISDYDFYDTGDENDHKLKFKSGNELQFIDAHFLHFPGAIATYDPVSGFLFSGDVWAAIDIEFKFIIQDFEYHKLKLNLFHLDYMSSSIATNGFARKLSDYDIKGILPQHGAIISSKDVAAAIDYLKELRCGLDLIYPDL